MSIIFLYETALGLGLFKIEQNYLIRIDHIDKFRKKKNQIINKFS